MGMPPMGGGGGGGMPSGGGMPQGGMQGGQSGGGGGGGSRPFGDVDSVGGRDGGGGGGAGAGRDAEGEFERSLGDFDDSLLEEQGRVAEVGRDTGVFESKGGSEGNVGLGEQAAGRRGSGGDQAGSNQGPQRGAAAGGDPYSREDRVGSVDRLTKSEIQERTPEDIPPPIDDDIVAKQLREAATAEEDPELRERLWKEYREYKGL